MSSSKPVPAWLKVRLPNYQQAQWIAPAYHDSTHLLWRLHGGDMSGATADDAAMFLKLCQQTQSPFWQVMTSLFGVELKRDIANFDGLYRLIGKAGNIAVPKLLQAENIEQCGAYVLTAELAGSAVKTPTMAMVKQLAAHMAKLHQYKSPNWGLLQSPKYAPQDWSIRLIQTLEKMPKRWGGANYTSNNQLKTAIEAIKQLKPTEFVPVMMDLRWDQFLQQNQQLSALVDLDAFVFAPRELDFVILESLLSPEQASVFIHTYRQYHALPDISVQRKPYRLLLFAMEVLGEADVARWLALPEFF